MLSLQDIKGPYHAIFSLGNNCLPGIELREHGLRRFAGPIDWMGTPVLPQISRMLRNRFEGMLVYSNLLMVNQASEELYNIWDQEYDLYLNHDFYVHNNFPPDLLGYPDVKVKYDRRIARFLQTLGSGGRILFIRTDSSREDIKELVDSLKQLCYGPFHVLAVNHEPVQEIEMLDWNLEHVCAVKMPNVDIWFSNRFRWSFLFQGMYLI
ncbi:hypothetical protein AK95_16605 [Paenibacillus sp. LC231]|uniref:DUF1796 family putative cysteine peptidase n=1 Tax=unclassified Paenibacillus TaxID=185978 RepID=UPI0008DE4A90|nr:MULTISPECIES: DUF1796 family putative cysteine peptidase [unclassified Paenibacillus]MCT1400795.1 papain-like cysteine peptidase [Paenibacillus sp. p3-SID867]OIA98779.1 hypothetical protein AK95_16605 [Paenibacillus sp. LC231]